MNLAAAGLQRCRSGRQAFHPLSGGVFRFRVSSSHVVLMSESMPCDFHVFLGNEMTGKPLNRHLSGSRSFYSSAERKFHNDLFALACLLPPSLRELNLSQHEEPFLQFFWACLFRFVALLFASVTQGYTRTILYTRWTRTLIYTCGNYSWLDIERPLPFL